MKTVFKELAGKPLTITMSDWDSNVDGDDLTRIHYEDLYGDAVTVSALLNKVGILQAKAEALYEHAKLKAEIEESNIRRRFRREAIDNAGYITIDDVRIKFTEKSLDDAVMLDKGLQTMKKNTIGAKEDWGKMTAIYWGVQSKDKKLNNLISGLTEEELWDQLVDGKINGILIKKRKSITELSKKQ